MQRLAKLPQELLEKNLEINNLKENEKHAKSEINRLCIANQTLQQSVERLTTLTKLQQKQIDELKKQIADPLTELLFKCLRENKTLQVEALIEFKDINFHAKDPEGNTPFVLSLILGQFELADQLLTKQPELNLFDDDILNRVLTCTNTNAIKFLLSKIPKDEIGINKLLLEYEKRNEVAVKSLIASALLWIAAKQGNLLLAYDALKRGAKINEQDFHKETALHKASYTDELVTVKFLLEHGANCNIQDSYGRLPAQVTYNELVKREYAKFFSAKANILQASIRGLFARNEATKLKQEHQDKQQRFTN